MHVFLIHTHADLPGVEVIGRTTFTVTNAADTFDWTEYGFKLTVPSNSLPAGMDQCQLDILASTAGVYKFPDNHHLVSGVFWVRPSAPGPFRQQLTMEIQHCAKITSFAKLSFVRASCTTTRPYIFKPLRSQYCSFSEQKGFVFVNHFSAGAVTVERENCPSIRKCCAILYYLEREVSLCTNIHVVVAWNTKVHQKVYCVYNNYNELTYSLRYIHAGSGAILRQKITSKKWALCICGV